MTTSFSPLRRSIACLFVAGLSLPVFGNPMPSEQDYFDEVPEVLTVTRLAQPLNETPGAVTVLDRDMIRRSGAREVTDLLRLVPGYLIGGLSPGNQSAAYHAPLDDYGVRNLILVDGRAIYSSLFMGGTHHGIKGVLLDDIERIEVLRGSNSAAYGANAVFGVINIVTRHAADTHGGALSVTAGEGGIRDNHARVGWGNELASFRLSAGRRGDEGYRGASDDYRISQLHFRGDLRPSADQEVMFSTGASELLAGDGFPDLVGNPERNLRWRDVYVNVQWRRQLVGGDELKLSANFDEENIRDRTPYAPIPGVFLDFGGKGRRLDIELQHRIGISPGLMAVWGAGIKHEIAYSTALFDARSPVSFSEKRLFGNLAWQPSAAWTFNAGGYLGSHSDIGGYFSPRFMANLHLSPEHTLRAGVSRSVRSPTLFEMNGDVRYYLNGTLIGRTTSARGNVAEEKLLTREIGYFGNLRDWRLTLDVRVFQERMADTIATQGYKLSPAEAAGLVTGNRVEDFVNDNWIHIHGAEYQLRWKPFDGTELLVNQVALDLNREGGGTNHMPPSHMATLALFQKLPLDLNLSLMWHSIGRMTWRDEERSQPAQRRVDMRLALPFRIGSTRAEAAVAVWAANGRQEAFFPYANHRLTEERRTFGTLRLEF